MAAEKLKFEELGTEERKILLRAMNMPLENLGCYYCKEKVDYKTCGIMPPIRRGEVGRITCDSPLCICEWLEDYERQMKEER